MKVQLTIVALLLAALPAARAQMPDAAREELERTEQTLQELTALKSQVVELQTRLDEIIRQLSERRGALANAKPAPFGGVAQPSAVPDRPDPKPRTVRCAALTREGDRCTRAAMPGNRYCKQHALAKSK